MSSIPAREATPGLYMATASVSACKDGHQVSKQFDSSIELQAPLRRAIHIPDIIYHYKVITFVCKFHMAQGFLPMGAKPQAVCQCRPSQASAQDCLKPIVHDHRKIHAINKV